MKLSSEIFLQNRSETQSQWCLTVSFVDLAVCSCLFFVCSKSEHTFCWCSFISALNLNVFSNCKDPVLEFYLNFLVEMQASGSIVMQFIDSICFIVENINRKYYFLSSRYVFPPQKNWKFIHYTFLWFSWSQTIIFQSTNHYTNVNAFAVVSSITICNTNWTKIDFEMDFIELMWSVNEQSLQLPMPH